MRKQLLELLIEHTRRQRDEAANLAARAGRLSNQANEVLNTLRNYRQDYDRKSPKVRGTAFDPQLIPRHEQFVQRLDVAVTDQVRQHQRLEEHALVRRTQLVAQEKRLKAFQTLRDRQAQLRARNEARREQFATDELASQLSKTHSNKDPT